MNVFYGFFLKAVLNYLKWFRNCSIKPVIDFLRNSPKILSVIGTRFLSENLSGNQKLRIPPKFISKYFLRKSFETLSEILKVYPQNLVGTF